MMPIRCSVSSHTFKPAVIVCGLLVLASSMFAATHKPPSLSYAKTGPQPQSVDQERQLANDYLVGHGVAQDFERSAYWFQKAAQGGDAQAQMQIGYFYDAGIGVPRNPEQAARWYQLAASDGCAAAKVSLGVLYMWGSGVRKDSQLAAQLFREAAGEGIGLGAFYLGHMYYFGDGVAQDKATGESWYLKGVKMHNPQSESDLGVLFFDSKDHVHDLRRAASLLRESAEAGYVPAKYSLAILLARNPNLAKSQGEMIGLVEESASAGVWKASMVLGILARDGKGFPLDPAAAYYHFRVAELQGGEEAKGVVDNDLRNLSSVLSAEQKAYLDAKASDWSQQHRTLLVFVYKKNRNGFPSLAQALPQDGTHTAQVLPLISN